MAKNKYIQVVVNRKKWCRGNEGYSQLLTKSGKMCCIGFLARALGCKPKEIRGVGVLEDVDSMEEFSSWASSTLTHAYEVNDDGHITESQREATLKKIGLKMHVKFTFIN